MNQIKVRKNTRSNQPRLCSFFAALTTNSLMKNTIYFSLHYIAYGDFVNQVFHRNIGCQIGEEFQGRILSTLL